MPIDEFQLGKKNEKNLIFTDKSKINVRKNNG